MFYVHGNKIESVKRQIERQVASGHELFVIVEHLHEHGWPWNIIEQAVYELDKTKRFAKELAHIKHTHHKKHHIGELAKWIQKYYSKHIDLETIIKRAKQKGWTEDDIRLSLEQVRLRKKDAHLKDFLES
jgi:hypothetical protein